MGVIDNHGFSALELSHHGPDIPIQRLMGISAIGTVPGDEVFDEPPQGLGAELVMGNDHLCKQSLILIEAGERELAIIWGYVNCAVKSNCAG